MNIRVIDHNVNVIAMEKNGKNYGMCCAWAMQVADDKLMCALGPQSDTGKALGAGDLVGFSNLKKGQEDIAFKLGDMNRHSAEADKLAGIACHTEEGAILIDGARAEAKCKVIEVLHLQQNEKENIVYLQILDGKKNEGEALRMSDLTKS